MGLWSHALGGGLFMSFVKEVVMDEDENDIVLILNEADMNGSSHETHVLYLYEIDRVYRFRLTPNRTLRVSSLNPE